MTKNIDTINAAVTIIIKVTVLAAMFSGSVRKPSLKRLSKMDIDDKDKEILFLRDKVDQASVFKGEACAELIEKYEIKHRFRAIKKHGSIAITERINKILKYEWLNKIPSLKVLTTSQNYALNLKHGIKAGDHT